MASAARMAKQGLAGCKMTRKGIKAQLVELAAIQPEKCVEATARLAFTPSLMLLLIH